MIRLSRSKNVPESAFDLTPMVDIVLLLIIFFMLSSQFAQAHRRPIDVPKEAGEPAPSESKELTIIDIEGPDRYFLFGQPMKLAELTSLIQANLKRQGAAAQLDITVRADRNSPASELNRLADALTKIGVRTWKLATVNPG